MPVAFVSVTNDLTTDQRVDRTCRTLVKSGYDVLLIGRSLKNSKPLKARPYRMHRMRLLFDKGPLFYAEYNITLFFFLLFHKSDLVVSNDLDTLPASYLASRLKRARGRRNRKDEGRRSKDEGRRTKEEVGSTKSAGSSLQSAVRNLNSEFSIPKSEIRNPKSEISIPKSEIRHLHDCHEYFRGVPELNGRKTVSRVWKLIEDRIFPRLEHVIAVNQSIADIYAGEYGNKITVIRNVPFRKSAVEAHDRSSLGIGPGQKIILYQGAVNVDRGLEEAILAMKHLETDAVLLIAGIGDIWDDLKKLTVDHGVASKVIFLGQVPFQELDVYTRMADLGLSIEKDVSINYRYCLPNKFLDYVQANVPVLVSPFPEMKAIVDRYGIGDFIESHDPVKLAAQLDSILNNGEKLALYRQNLLKAAEDLCWESEEPKLMKVL